MRRRTGTAYGFLAPYLLVFAAFWVWPIIYSFWLSFLATRTLPWTFRPSMTWGRLAQELWPSEAAQVRNYPYAATSRLHQAVARVHRIVSLLLRAPGALMRVLR